MGVTTGAGAGVGAGGGDGIDGITGVGACGSTGAPRHNKIGHWVPAMYRIFYKS